MKEILTRADGTPFEKPERPGRFATVNEWYEYYQALWRYKDEVRAYAEWEFCKALTRELK